MKELQDALKSVEMDLTMEAISVTMEIMWMEMDVHQNVRLKKDSNAHLEINIRQVFVQTVETQHLRYHSSTQKIKFL